MERSSVSPLLTPIEWNRTAEKSIDSDQITLERQITDTGIRGYEVDEGSGVQQTPKQLLVVQDPGHLLNRTSQKVKA